MLFFFFSSRRRHTRYWRDWSSDVCSSDLAAGGHGRALYVCYEHSEEFLLERLIAMESALAGEEDPISVGDLRNLLAGSAGTGSHHGGIGELLAELGHT